MVADVPRSRRTAVLNPVSADDGQALGLAFSGGGRSVVGMGVEILDPVLVMGAAIGDQWFGIAH
jgi:hypothetical protein